MSLRTKITALRTISDAELRFIAEAALLLGVSRVLLLTVPFRRIAPLLSRPPAGAPTPVDPLLSRSVRRAVTIAARNVPFRAVCLPQAMAAKFMLARRGQPSTLHLGIGKDDAGNLMAHAWLQSDGAIVVGEAGVGDVTPIARYG
jgi:Transglutaminase-like superfamily